MTKSLGVKLPLILDVVEDEDMIETIRAGKHMIIAIPIEDIQTPGEEVNCRYSHLEFECPKTPTDDCFVFCADRRIYHVSGETANVE